MIDRYPTLDQLRLDASEDQVSGQAFDVVYRKSAKRVEFWVRSDRGDSLSLKLTLEDLAKLRDGCNRILIGADHEKALTIAVPK